MGSEKYFWIFQFLETERATIDYNSRLHVKVNVSFLFWLVQNKPLNLLWILDDSIA